MMAQTIARATKNELQKTKASFNRESGLNNESQVNVNQPGLSIDSLEEEETDEGEMEKLLRSTDYIDVSEQGTISNASRLDRVLKDRERYKYKRTKQSGRESMGAMVRDDISYLFDMDMSNTERESLFLKFEVSDSSRNQLSGALTALAVLMENERITDSIILGESYKNPILNVLDDIVFDIDDIDNSIYNPGRTKGRNSVPSTLGGTRNSLITTGIAPGVAGLRLPERIRSLVQQLVYFALYPALGAWASENYQNYPINTFAKSKAADMFADVIKWICKFSEFPDFNQVLVSSTNVKLGGKREENSMFYKSMQGEYDTKSRHKLSRHRHGDLSSDSEDDYDSDEDSEIVSIYPMESKQDRSTAETSGKNENANPDDILTVQSTSDNYLGFSSRALTLLNSLLRHCMSRSDHFLIFINCLFFLID